MRRRKRLTLRGSSSFFKGPQNRYSNVGLGSRIYLLRWGRSLLMFVLNPLRRFITWTVEYDGFAAELVKCIPVVLMAACIFYPWYTYPLWVWLGYSLGSSLNYLVYALWLTQFVLAAIGSAVIRYLQEAESD